MSEDFNEQEYEVEEIEDVLELPVGESTEEIPAVPEPVDWFQAIEEALEGLPYKDGDPRTRRELAATVKKVVSKLFPADDPSRSRFKDHIERYFRDYWFEMFLFKALKLTVTGTYLNGEPEYQSEGIAGEAELRQIFGGMPLWSVNIAGFFGGSGITPDDVKEFAVKILPLAAARFPKKPAS